MTRPEATSVPPRQGTDLVEKIYSGEQCLAYVIKASFLPERTTFLTPPDYKQQVGYVVYPAGGEIQRHVHRPLERVRESRRHRLPEEPPPPIAADGRKDW